MKFQVEEGTFRVSSTNGYTTIIRITPDGSITLKPISDGKDFPDGFDRVAESVVILRDIIDQVFDSN